MSENDEQQQWNQRYRNVGPPPTAAEVLRDHRHLLPTAGRALDLACGLGANALLLAAHGLDTDAWDFAETAVQNVQARASAANLSINVQQRDVVQQPPAADSFNVIVVSHFLERSLAPALIAALRRDGLLFYQTFTKNRVAPEIGPRKAAFLLDDNELLHLFAPLKIIIYREEGIIGDCTTGFRNKALLIAQRIV